MPTNSESVKFILEKLTKLNFFNDKELELVYMIINDEEYMASILKITNIIFVGNPILYEHMKKMVSGLNIILGIEDHINESEQKLRINIKFLTKCFINIAATYHIMLKIHDDNHTNKWDECLSPDCMSNQEVLRKFGHSNY